MYYIYFYCKKNIEMHFPNKLIYYIEKPTYPTVSIIELWNKLHSVQE